MERDELEQVYQKYYRAALLYTCSLCPDVHLAEDIVQEAFVRAYLSLPKESPSFPCWLMTVCRHLLIDAQRRRKHLSASEVPDAPGGDLPEELLVQKEQTLRLYRALRRLAPPDREMLTLYYFARLPLAQIAQTLHLTPSAAKVRLHRARGRLRIIMEEDNE